jgi:hypothetical protein
VAADYSGLERLDACRFLITYTCDLMPTPEQAAQIKAWLDKGGKWMALHGTNSILVFTADGLVDAPDDRPDVMEMLGTQFVAHPPIGKFPVEVVNKDHELVKGIERLRGGGRALPVQDHRADRHPDADHLRRRGDRLLHMDFSPEELAFREEVRTFLAENLPAHIREGSRNTPSVFVEPDIGDEWQRILHEKGWLAYHWPKEAGGTGWDPVQRYIFEKECALADAPALSPCWA